MLAQGGIVRGGGVARSRHGSGLAFDLANFAKAIENVCRPAGNQIHLFARHLLKLRFEFPEFKKLDDMRWEWPTWRVRKRPFDFEIDAGVQRGPEGRRLGEVRWFS